MRTHGSRRRGGKGRVVALLSRALVLVARPIRSCMTLGNDPETAKANRRRQSVDAQLAGQYWSDLPGDLLIEVYGRLPTALNRVRLSAVCRSWRAAVTSRHMAASPAMIPCLLFPPRGDGSAGTTTERLMYCPEDGGVIRVSLPSVAIDRRLVGSHAGGWVAAFDHGRRILSVVNLFSGAEVTLSENQRRLMCTTTTTHGNHPFRIRKLIFSEAPTSSGCILAAITRNWRVALCKVGLGLGLGGWSMAPCNDAEHVWDLAFCNGELYGLTAYGEEEVIRYEIGVDDDGVPVVTVAHQLAIEKRGGGGRTRFMNDPLSYVTYLVELCGKPVIAVRARWSWNHEPSFRVFELSSTGTNGGTYNYKWVEVTSLGDHALFVGPMSSCKAANISACRRGGVESNHVYYFNHRFVFTDDSLAGEATCMDDNGGHALYSGDESNGTERKIVSVGYYVIHPSSAIWILPPDL